MQASRRDFLRNTVVMAAAAPLASHAAYPATSNDSAVKIVHFFAGIAHRSITQYCWGSVRRYKSAPIQKGPAS
jgi:hypothetical protein